MTQELITTLFVLCVEWSPRAHFFWIPSCRILGHKIWSSTRPVVKTGTFIWLVFDRHCMYWAGKMKLIKLFTKKKVLQYMNFLFLARLYVQLGCSYWLVSSEGELWLVGLFASVFCRHFVDYSIWHNLRPPGRQLKTICKTFFIFRLVERLPNAQISFPRKNV